VFVHFENVLPSDHFIGTAAIDADAIKEEQR
jgi:hypothetical protein